MAAAPPASAQRQPELDIAETVDVAPARGWETLLEGWSDFGDGWLLLDMIIVLLIALLLGAVIGYHPATRRRMSSLEQFEQPKTVLMYSMVAAVVALLVKVQPAMAFVIFGIGGLLRFRTLVGEAKDTGRVILVTVFEAAGLIVIGEQTKFIKREFAFVVKAPPAIDREKLDREFDALPGEIRGVVDWEQL
jgi:hypothetical protein